MYRNVPELAKERDRLRKLNDDLKAENEQHVKAIELMKEEFRERQQ